MIKKRGDGGAEGFGGTAHKARTQSKQLCDRLLGREPPVEKRRFRGSRLWWSGTPVWSAPVYTQPGNNGSVWRSNKSSLPWRSWHQTRSQSSSFTRTSYSWSLGLSRRSIGYVLQKCQWQPMWYSAENKSHSYSLSFFVKCSFEWHHGLIGSHSPIIVHTCGIRVEIALLVQTMSWKWDTGISVQRNDSRTHILNICRYESVLFIILS